MTVGDDIFSEITNKISEIDETLIEYREIASKFRIESNNIYYCDEVHGVDDVLNEIDENEEFIKTLNYSSIKEDDNARDVATGRANSAYQQAEQSTMMYNISVSSLVNIISGVLILIYFICKELGLSIKNMAKGAATAVGAKKAADSLTKTDNKAKTDDNKSKTNDNKSKTDDNKSKTNDNKSKTDDNKSKTNDNKTNTDNKSKSGDDKSKTDNKANTDNKSDTDNKANTDNKSKSGDSVMKNEDRDKKDKTPNKKNDDTKSVSK